MIVLSRVIKAPTHHSATAGSNSDVVSLIAANMVIGRQETLCNQDQRTHAAQPGVRSCLRSGRRTTKANNAVKAKPDATKNALTGYISHKAPAISDAGK